MSDSALSNSSISDRAIKGGTLLISSDIIRGHLDAIILRLICEKDRYGYEISNEIANRTNNEFQIKEATLYAVFQRLVKKELIESYLGDVSLGGRRRYYRITSLGRAYLNEEIRNWHNARDIIDIFMEGLQ
jgi:PadR family transcriptional regulator, regulatory protein PadR